MHIKLMLIIIIIIIKFYTQHYVLQTEQQKGLKETACSTARSFLVKEFLDYSYLINKASVNEAAM